MRITNSMLTDNTLRNLKDIMTRLNKLQDELGSGKQIKKPSDDPIAVASALEYRSEISGLDQHKLNNDAAKSWLSASDSALDSVDQVLSRARELAVQGANTTLSAQDRQASAAELDQLIDEAVSLGNSKYGDQYVFAGHKTTAPPVASDAGGPHYNGDTGSITREIAAGTTMTINVTGDTVFPHVLGALKSLRDSLQSDNVPVVDSSITQIDQAMDTVLSKRASVGAKMNRLDMESSRLEDLRLSAKDLLSKAEDVDMTQAIVDLSSQQAVYNAALAAGARAIQPSLLSFLK